MAQRLAAAFLRMNSHKFPLAFGADLPSGEFQRYGVLLFRVDRHCYSAKALHNSLKQFPTRSKHRQFLALRRRLPGDWIRRKKQNPFAFICSIRYFQRCFVSASVHCFNFYTSISAVSSVWQFDHRRRTARGQGSRLHLERSYIKKP